jgi:hypothetical protein
VLEGPDRLFCHATGQNPLLRWTLAGTLWDSAYGTVARAGATIDIVDARGQALHLVTDVCGWVSRTSIAIITATASDSSRSVTKRLIGSALRALAGMAPSLGL